VGGVERIHYSFIHVFSYAVDQLWTSEPVCFILMDEKYVPVMVEQLKGGLACTVTLLTNGRKLVRCSDEIVILQRLPALTDIGIEGSPRIAYNHEDVDR